MFDNITSKGILEGSLGGGRTAGKSWNKWENGRAEGCSQIAQYGKLGEENRGGLGAWPVNRTKSRRKKEYIYIHIHLIS
jgi:hypothetical protein